MRFIFVSTPTFEPWDWTNPDTKGIGGSETSHIEMARRLAERGHEVYSFAPVPFRECRTGPGGVLWQHTDDLRQEIADHSQAIWVVYRDPAFCATIPRDAGPVWHIAQDVDYIGYNRRGDFVPRNYNERIDRVVTLCQSHAIYTRREHPELANKICVSSNGVKAEMIRELLSGPIPVRNPKRLIYASSPDRGLLPLISIFQRAKELVPDLELHVCYGFNNLETWVKGVKERKPDAPVQSQAEYNLRMMKDALSVPGVITHGRIPQRELAIEWLKSGIWCHPSNFSETSCITCMDAQALGAIPITIPFWAVGENVQHGIFIQGDAAADPLTRARFAFELAKLATDPERQEAIRSTMMPWALHHFDWEQWVDQWEGWAITDAVCENLKDVTEPVPEGVPA